jgi:hypothetical protein
MTAPAMAEETTSSLDAILGTLAHCESPLDDRLRRFLQGAQDFPLNLAYGAAELWFRREYGREEEVCFT